VAAVGAAFIATALLTGLADYSREVIAAGGRSAVESAPPDERALVVRGAAGADAAENDARDSALRAAVAGGVGGRPATVSAAGYAVGREFSGDFGSAVPDKDGDVFATTVFLERLADHASLATGAWPQPGSSPVQVTLPEAAAATLGTQVGDRIPITDRRTGEVSEVLLAGIWRPVDLTDPYWLLVPGVGTGVAPASNSYGPVVLDRVDFMRGYAYAASLGWVIQPDLTGVGLPELRQIGRDVEPLVESLPRAAGLAGSGHAGTNLGRLVDRLQRADLVGRSALLTPVLLIVVLGGYALLLVALLLNEHRRTETALMRARGAARGQLARLATREAALVVLPGALLAPAIATEVLRCADRLPLFADVSLRLDPQPGTLAWVVAGAAAAGCLLAMLGPAMRRTGTYVEELSSRSRPNRFAVAQRAGSDLALIGFALLAWFQLKQYSSPLAGAAGRLGIDPLLAAAPTIGVLAGAVLALRLLPRLTRLAERYVDRKPWTATMLGMWQAGRRPHAGPVLLLALAVAVSTLAWCLASTAERSLLDQADHEVGADLRLVESSGFAPANRPGQLAALPGARTVLPAVRDSLRLGPESTPAAFVAIDAAAAADVVSYRADLVDGSPGALFARLTRDRVDLPTTPLPPGTTRLSGEILTQVDNPLPANEIETLAILTNGHGQIFRVPLGRHLPGRGPVRFDTALPDLGTRTPALIGFDIATITDNLGSYRWQLRDAMASTQSGERVMLDLGSDGDWLLVDRERESDRPSAGPGTITAGFSVPRDNIRGFRFGVPVRLSIARSAAKGPVPVVVTGEALRALGSEVGDGTEFNVAGARVAVRIVDEVGGVPGTGDAGAAVLADLPSLAAVLYRQGIVPLAQEYWVAVAPGRAQTAATAADALGNLTVLDRDAIATTAGREPYGVGGRAGLFAAALGAVLLALVGMAVDVRATARRRVGEFAVFNTLGAGPRLLARALMAEQAFLAGLGVVVGVLVGVGVAATMAPLVILTPSANRPVPEPLLAVAWGPVAATVIGLFAVSLVMGALVATTMRQRLAAAQLRIGEDR
jgi:hypothetical protein